MPLYFQRPENALKRASEFIDVGKKQRALDALYDVIKSRKHRTWQKIHEPIMMKYLQLCVDLKKSHIAKEGLFQYRNICQQVNIKSLEDVVRSYLQLAEEKTEAAREESQQAVVDIDDLDNVQTPESLLLSAVSSEDTQDRTDRVVLTPWVKFLWESYRQCLELLRNNSRVERLYHDIAQQAFKFCLRYSRKTEFRKLCDNLRAHLGHIHKHQNQQTAVNLNNPESQAMHLETRLVQLESAIQMELWQEAYKAIEDIHGLMNLSKKQPKAQLMANYYQKLSLVFWKAGNLLFHASALFRLFHLSRELKRNITQDEIQRMASRVVLATLAVPMPPNRPEIDRLVETDENVIDKNHRLLAMLLGLSNPPTRSSLVKDLIRFGVIQAAPSQLQELYRLLETDFHPLKLCPRVSQCFDFINKWEDYPDLRQYISALQDITIMRLLKEVSQVYQSIEFSRLLELTPFATPFYLENMVVEAARRNDLQVRIDHRQRCLHFGSELSVSQREEIVEGPHLQSMPSEQIRSQLVTLYSVLHKCVELIQPEKIKLAREELREQIVTAYNLTSKKEHQRILERRQIIEERKEMIENLSYQKEEEERRQLEERQQKLREAEKERMARETEERAKQRILREQNELKKKVVMEKIEQLKKTELGARIFEGLEEEELQKLDPEEILSRQVEQLDRERKELQAKLRKQERKVDHLERAKRLEEIPLLQKAYEEFRIEDQKFWEQQEKERISKLKEERQSALEHRDRLLRMREDKNKFVERLKAGRSSVYKEKLMEFEKMLSEERNKRLEQRKAERREEQRKHWLLMKKKEAEERKQQEEKREYEARMAKLEEIEAKKRAREKELEEKMKQQKEEALKKEREEKETTEEKRSEPWKPSGSWRERELAKRDSWRPRDSDKDVRGKDDENTWRKKDEDIPKRVEEPVRSYPDDDWRKQPRKERDEREDSWRRDDGDRRYPQVRRAPYPEHEDWRKPQEERSEYGRGFDRDIDRDDKSWRDRRDNKDFDRRDREFNRDERRDFDRRDRDFDRNRDDRRDRDYNRRPGDFDRRDERRDRDFDRRDREFDRNKERDFDRRDRDFDRNRDRERTNRDRGGYSDRIPPRGPRDREDRRMGSDDRNKPSEDGNWRSSMKKEGSSSNVWRDNKDKRSDRLRNKEEPDEEGWKRVCR
ncbi:eukaryotic translation initiation factor 3 subunit A-like [Centruroides sculpturatus]|uniref:eukaryotic translation initiation factor 3 subunit A-like n=1 Tax=Centruroides sculpturatus TaxID=218467 RepID=UPI000C6D07C6|nr:eukaryotic translation initiation factor 3 subunit A-like [Centruroides sculpturatus]